jgi:hypothetical protein
VSAVRVPEVGVSAVVVSAVGASAFGWSGASASGVSSSEKRPRWAWLAATSMASFGRSVSLGPLPSRGTTTPSR